MISKSQTLGLWTQSKKWGDRLVLICSRTDSTEGEWTSNLQYQILWSLGGKAGTSCEHIIIFIITLWVDMLNSLAKWSHESRVKPNDELELSSALKLHEAECREIRERPGSRYWIHHDKDMWYICPSCVHVRTSSTFTSTRVDVDSTHTELVARWEQEEHFANWFIQSKSGRVHDARSSCKQLNPDEPSAGLGPTVPVSVFMWTHSRWLQGL